MAPTSKLERRRSIPKVDNEDQLDTGFRNVQKAASDGVVYEGQLKRAIVGLPGQGNEADADTDGTPESLPFISLPYLPPPYLPPSDSAEGRPVTTLVPIQETDIVAAPAAAPAPNPTFKTISRAIPKPTSTSISKRPIYTVGSILPKGTATGIAGNFQSASIRPQRTTLSAALPKATDVDSEDDSDDSDDSDEDEDDVDSDDEDKEKNRKASAGKTSKSTSTARPVTTSSIMRDQRAGITMTGVPKASGPDAVTTSRGITGGEKAAIAIGTIGFVVILLAMLWFFLRRSSKRNPGSKPVWPPSFPSGNNLADGTRRVSSKVGDKFLSFRDRIVPGASGWSSLDDGMVYDNDKSPILEASDAKAKRGKRTTTTPPRIMVNPYGMIFRKPKHDSTWSDIMLPAGEKAPPLPSSPAASLARKSVMSEKIPHLEIPSMPPMPPSVMSPTTSVSPSSAASDKQAAAAAHLESARKSVAASLHNKSLQTPLRRNTNVSDVSSLSSGFGDGDIIITPPGAVVAMKSADSQVNLVAVRGSESFASQSSGSRDTVYTSVSDDSRPHFRPVSAWVRQQSRRAKTAAPSEENGIPAMPDASLEQGFDLMMPDEQEPRRVESSMWKDKKVEKETA